MLTAKVTGMKRLETRLKQRMEKYGRQAAKGLQAGAQAMFEVAQYLVPIDTGELTSKGFVTSKGQGFQTVISVGYGPVWYVARVHEDLELTHGWAFNEKYAFQIAQGETHERRPQEQAKWLEDADKMSRGTIAKYVKEAMQK